ncbi:MAG: ethanolamine ammonia-lyase subunit EutC [Cytophagales bacterium]|nr:ethanolamine ammonia-lyase subunit EutC [Cytophagales bacterium]
MHTNHTPMSDPWKRFKEYTQARIGLGRAGTSLPTDEHLQFRQDHALARDAVWHPVDFQPVEEWLTRQARPFIRVSSQAATREEYLKRPDLGRRLSPESLDRLSAVPRGSELVIVLADGLSALAAAGFVPLLHALLPLLKASQWSLAPILLAEQGRVALGDELAEGLRARAVWMIVGERPGLSAADSLGAYYTYQPRRGLTDERRNCISNIRPGGLSYPLAAAKMMHLMEESFRLRLSGVELKENYDGEAFLVASSE